MVRRVALGLFLCAMWTTAGCTQVPVSKEPSVPEARGDGWTTASATSAGMAPERLLAMDAAIRSNEFKKITSVVIARQGKLVYEAYFGGANFTTLMNTRSATKTVTSMLVGVAIDRGLLAGVDALVLPFFADRVETRNADPRKQAITVEDLLTMSSALECNDSDDKSAGNEERMYPTKDWLQFALSIPAKPAAPPGNPAPPYGRSFSYCTAGVFTLGQVLGRATKTPVDEFAKKALFAPMGIEKMKWAYSPIGQPQTGGGLELASRDLLKLGQLGLNGGMWNGTRLVPDSWFKQSTQPHARVDDSTEYGYLWWLRGFNAGGKTFAAYSMFGNGGNKVSVFPQLELVVVITSTNYNTKGMHQQTDRLLTDFILASLGN